MRIHEVRAITCDIPLTRPIAIGDTRFDSREYVIVQVVADDGRVGTGFGMTRGGPVASVVSRSLTPHLIGQDPLLIEAIWEALYYRNLPIGQRGIFMRALSAVDIALWDLKAQVASLPLWKLLGGARDKVPVWIAGGYPSKGITLDDLAREMSDYEARGFGTVKIAAGDLATDTDRLETARRALGSHVELAYDAHWAWRDLLTVVRTVRSWDRLGLLFVEDPFPSEMVELADRLRADTGVRLALGEDVAGRWAFRHILDVVRPDVLRLDATAMGGISEAVRVCALASSMSIPVFPHVFPEVHVHLAAGLAGVAAVEMTDPAYEIESLYRLFRRWVDVTDGIMSAPETPGLGVELDPDALERFAVA